MATNNNDELPDLDSCLRGLYPSNFEEAFMSLTAGTDFYSPNYSNPFGSAAADFSFDTNKDDFAATSNNNNLHKDFSAFFSFDQASGDASTSAAHATQGQGDEEYAPVGPVESTASIDNTAMTQATASTRANNITASDSSTHNSTAHGFTANNTTASDSTVNESAAHDTTANVSDPNIDKPFTLDLDDDGGQFADLFGDVSNNNTDNNLFDFFGDGTFARPSATTGHGTFAQPSATTGEQSTQQQQHLGWASPAASVSSSEHESEGDQEQQHIGWASPAASVSKTEQNNEGEQPMETGWASPTESVTNPGHVASGTHNMGWASPSFANDGPQQQNFGASQNQGWFTPPTPATPVNSQNYQTPPSQSTIWSTGGKVPNTPPEPTREELMAAEIASLKTQLAQAQSQSPPSRPPVAATPAPRAMAAGRPITRTPASHTPASHTRVAPTPASHTRAAPTPGSYSPVAPTPASYIQAAPTPGLYNHAAPAPGSYTPAAPTPVAPKTPSSRKRNSSNAFNGDVATPTRPRNARPTPITPSTGHGLIESLWSPKPSLDEGLLLVQQFNNIHNIDEASSLAANNFIAPATPTPAAPPAKKRRVYKRKDPNAPKKTPASRQNGAKNSKKGNTVEESVIEQINGEYYLTAKAAKMTCRPIADIVDLPFDSLTHLERATLLLPFLQGLDPISGEKTREAGTLAEQTPAVALTQQNAGNMMNQGAGNITAQQGTVDFTQQQGSVNMNGQDFSNLSDQGFSDLLQQNLTAFFQENSADALQQSSADAFQQNSNDAFQQASGNELTFDNAFNFENFNGETAFAGQADFNVGIIDETPAVEESYGARRQREALKKWEQTGGRRR